MPKSMFKNHLTIVCALFSSTGALAADDAFDAASCSGAVSTDEIEALLPGGSTRAVLGPASFVGRTRHCPQGSSDGACAAWGGSSLVFVVTLPGVGPAGNPKSVEFAPNGTISVERSGAGVQLFWRMETARVLGVDGAYYDVSPNIRCDNAQLIGDRVDACPAVASVRKVGASVATSMPLFARLTTTSGQPTVDGTVAFTPRISMTPRCARLASASGRTISTGHGLIVNEIAGLFRLPLFDFSLPALADTLEALGDYVYATKAPLLRRGADLAQQAPLPDGRDVRLFVMAALRPVIDSTSTALFEERVMPAYAAGLTSAFAAAGFDGLADVPFSASVRMASMWLLSTALGICKDSVSDPALRSVLDASIFRAGQALARGAPADETLGALAAARPASDLLEGLAAGGPAQSAALLVMTLLNYGELHD